MTGVACDDDEEASINGFGGLTLVLDDGRDEESIIFGLLVRSIADSGLAFLIALLVFARTSILTLDGGFLTEGEINFCWEEEGEISAASVCFRLLLLT